MIGLIAEGPATLDPEIDLNAWWIESLLVQLVGNTRRPNRRWVMSTATLNLIRRLKDPSGGYLWYPSLASTGPDLLYGCPIEIDEAALGATLEYDE